MRKPRFGEVRQLALGNRTRMEIRLPQSLFWLHISDLYCGWCVQVFSHGRIMGTRLPPSASKGTSGCILSHTKHSPLITSFLQWCIFRNSCVSINTVGSPVQRKLQPCGFLLLVQWFFKLILYKLRCLSRELEKCLPKSTASSIKLWLHE